MSDNVVNEINSPPAVATPSIKKKAATRAKKKPNAAPSHPSVAEMVKSAITSLKERGGSSLQAIKKHIGTHYNVDMERLSPFIKKYVKNAVGSGALFQTKGKGATGSFKLGRHTEKKETSSAAAGKLTTKRKVVKSAEAPAKKKPKAQASHSKKAKSKKAMESKKKIAATGSAKKKKASAKEPKFPAKEFIKTSKPKTSQKKDPKNAASGKKTTKK